jgi:hypothetical protein
LINITPKLILCVCAKAPEKLRNGLDLTHFRRKVSLVNNENTYYYDDDNNNSRLSYCFNKTSRLSTGNCRSIEKIGKEA